MTEARTRHESAHVHSALVGTDSKCPGKIECSTAFCNTILLARWVGVRGWPLRTVTRSSSRFFPQREILGSVEDSFVEAWEGGIGGDALRIAEEPVGPIAEKGQMVSNPRKGKKSLLVKVLEKF